MDYFIINQRCLLQCSKQIKSISFLFFAFFLKKKDIFIGNVILSVTLIFMTIPMDTFKYFPFYSKMLIFIYSVIIGFFKIIITLTNERNFFLRFFFLTIKTQFICNFFRCHFTRAITFSFVTIHRCCFFKMAHLFAMHFFFFYITSSDKFVWALFTILLS